jgi:hypothetical protein
MSKNRGHDRLDIPYRYVGRAPPPIDLTMHREIKTADAIDTGRIDDRPVFHEQIHHAPNSR